MKLERHVGGLSLARKARYLNARGWRAEDGKWANENFGIFPINKAIHHQLTEDLTQALRRVGWQVEGYSERGYVKLRDPQGGRPCSLPKALRTQAKRERQKVGDFTYSLFLDALLTDESLSGRE
jgi:hypothetical protein